MTPNPYSHETNIPRRDLSQCLPLPGPLLVFVEPTNVCNFKCTFCPESHPDYKTISGGNHMMSMDNFKKVADQLKLFGTVEKLNLYVLGEPFSNRNLLSFVEYARDIRLCDRIFVTTNGSLVKPELYERICASGLHHMKVSIYGATEESQKARTQSQISLAKVKANIAGLKAYRDTRGLKLPIIYTKMISVNPEEDAKFLEEFSGVGDEISLLAAMNWNDEAGNLSGMEKETMLQQDYFTNKKEVCPFPFYTLTIHADLNVSICHMDWNKKGLIGNVKTETLQEMWRGQRLRDFQLTHIRRKRCELEACKDCTFLHTAKDQIDGMTEEAFADRAAARGVIAAPPWLNSRMESLANRTPPTVEQVREQWLEAAQHRHDDSPSYHLPKPPIVT